MLTDSAAFACPWCGQENFLELDPEEDGQTLVQDCRICCRPIELTRQPDGSVHVRREAD